MHAASRFRTRQLAPQNRRQLEADEIVECAAGEIGVHEIGIDLAWRFHRVKNGGLCNGIKDDALDAFVFENLFGLQNFQHMPGNGLALAIRVGSQNDGVGIFYSGGDLGQALGGLEIDFPFHRKIIIRIDRPILRWKVADMAE